MPSQSSAYGRRERGSAAQGSLKIDIEPGDFQLN